MQRTTTLNVRDNPIVKQRAKLQKGYDDIEVGKVQNAAEAFQKFRQTHI